MTVPIETSRVTAVGNGGATIFPTTFYFLEAADLRVSTKTGGASEVILTMGAHYTVQMPAAIGGGGTITFVAPPAVGVIITITRDVYIIQPTNFRTAGDFSPVIHERAMDRIVMEVQEQARDIADLQSAGAPGSVIAGNGLFFSGSTLHVGAGAGIVTESDTVSIYFPGEGFDLGQVLSDAQSPDPGSTDVVARVDHTHVANTAAPSALTAGGALVFGASSSLSRADHRHAMPTSAPVNVNAGAIAVGSSGNFADASHKHSVDTASAIELTDATNAAGSGDFIALANHTHAHGNRGGGTLHTVATSSVAGFMSAADKVKLDATSTSQVVSTGGGKTTGVTPTTMLTFTPADDTTEFIEIAIAAKATATSKAAGYRKSLVVYRQGGTTLVSTIETVDKETDAGWDATVSVASPAVNVVVTGADATNINWVVVARRTIASGS